MRTFIDLIAGLSLTRDHGRADWLADRAALTADDRVLDIGCGPGNGLVAAATRGAAAIGLDPSPTMLGLAARRAPGATLVAASVESIPLPSGSVTVAWAVGSFHHWRDTTAGLAELRRVLVPAGRLFVIERRAHGRGFHATHAITPARGDDLVSDLSAAGFVDAAIEDVGVGGRELLLVSARTERERADNAVVV